MTDFLPAVNELKEYLKKDFRRDYYSFVLGLKARAEALNEISSKEPENGNDPVIGISEFRRYRALENVEEALEYVTSGMEAIMTGLMLMKRPIDWLNNPEE